MTQRSTRSEPRSKPSTPTANTAHRIDTARHQSSRWISRIRQTLPNLKSHAPGDTEHAPDTSATPARFDRLIRQDNRHEQQNLTNNDDRSETAFERSMRDLLAVPRWRSQVTDLAQSLNELVQQGPLTVAIVSLSDEFDAARTVFALALLHGESGREVLVVDGDRHRRTLSILLQQNNACGLWDAIPTGKPARTLSIPLASRGVSFVPSGSRTFSAAGTHADRSLRADRGTCALMLMDAGVWPTPDLPTFAPVADRVYAVVRCGNTHRKSYRELMDLLRQSGKRIAGCIVAGSLG